MKISFKFRNPENAWIFRTGLGEHKIEINGSDVLVTVDNPSNMDWMKAKAISLGGFVVAYDEDDAPSADVAFKLSEPIEKLPDPPIPVPVPKPRRGR